MHEARENGAPEVDKSEEPSAGGEDGPGDVDKHHNEDEHAQEEAEPEIMVASYE